MSRYTAAAFAFALGASAMPAPHWGWGGWGEGANNFPQHSYGGEAPSMPAVPSMPAGPTGGAPAPTGGFPAPSGSAPAFTYSQIANATAPSYVGLATASGASGSAPAVTSAPAASAPAGGASSGGDMPASSGTSVLSAVQTIAAGESFDGGMVAFDRGVSCTGQEEGGDSDAVFEIEDGGSLSNVIIGPNQIEGVHCYGSCTLTNVWWSAVCEDAFTIKEQSDSGTTTITGGGAYGAEDKVLQHNGGGTMSVSGFTVDDFGKLYRSCGNCDEMPARHIILDDITATSGSTLVGKSARSLPPFHRQSLTIIWY